VKHAGKLIRGREGAQEKLQNVTKVLFLILSKPHLLLFIYKKRISGSYYEKKGVFWAMNSPANLFVAMLLPERCQIKFRWKRLFSSCGPTPLIVDKHQQLSPRLSILAACVRSENYRCLINLPLKMIFSAGGPFFLISSRESFLF
jgi:hypothetical protein